MRSLLHLTLLLLTIATTGVLGWLSRTPWWGWAIAMALVVGLAFVLHRLQPTVARFVRLGAWLLGAALACLTMVLTLSAAGHAGGGWRRSNADTAGLKPPKVPYGAS